MAEVFTRLIGLRSTECAGNSIVDKISAESTVIVWGYVLDHWHWHDGIDDFGVNFLSRVQICHFTTTKTASTMLDT